MNKQLPFWLITISVFIGLILPVLIQDGMFMDGLLYTTVAKNLSNGIGNFWFPVFNKIGVYTSTFHEQPPLAFAIQSVFFDVFGNSIYTERIYSMVMAFVTLYLIIILWKQITNHLPIKKVGWLPILLWIIIPVCYWQYQNVVNEVTMGVFILLAIVFGIKSMNKNLFNKRYLYVLGLAISVFLASFSKGVPGLFPLLFFVIYWIIDTKRYSTIAMLKDTLISVGAVTLIYTLLITFSKEAKESLSIYFFERLLYRINENPTVENRFYILYQLFLQLLPVIIFIVLLIIIFKVKNNKLYFNKEYKKIIALMFIIGFSGSLPLVLTKVQREFYFTPSLPFFAIGFSLIVAKQIEQWISKIKISFRRQKMYNLLTSSLLIIVVGVSFIQKGKFSRDEKLLQDIYKIGEIVPENTYLSMISDIQNEWRAEDIYLQRHFNITVDDNSKQMHDYVLIDKTIDTTRIKGNYKKILIQTNQYNLYYLKK